MTGQFFYLSASFRALRVLHVDCQFLTISAMAQKDFAKFLGLFLCGVCVLYVIIIKHINIGTSYAVWKALKTTIAFKYMVLTTVTDGMRRQTNRQTDSLCKCFVNLITGFGCYCVVFWHILKHKQNVWLSGCSECLHWVTSLRMTSMRSARAGRSLYDSNCITPHHLLRLLYMRDL